MNIEEVKAYHEDECGMGFSCAADNMIDWLISEYDRLTAANKTLTDALKDIIDERGEEYGDSDYQCIWAAIERAKGVIQPTGEDER